MRKNPEPTRTREHGTRVTKALSGDERIAAIRDIVAKKQYAKVDGTMIDLFSAGVIVQVYDALSPENQAKFSALRAGAMGVLAFRVIKKVS